MIALIAVSAAVYAIDKPYSYRTAQWTVVPGMRVQVPFGRGNRRCEGMVLALQTGDEGDLKAIGQVLDQEPVLSEAFLRLAAFVRDRYFCTYYEAIKAMLPAGLWFDAAVHLELADPDMDPSVITRQPLARQVAEALKDAGGRGELSALRRQFPDEAALQKALQYLAKKALIHSDTDFAKRVRDKTEQVASLAVPAEEAMAYAASKRSQAPMQYEILKLLCAIGSGSAKEICYLTGASMPTVRRLEKLGYVNFSARETFRRPTPDYVKPAGPLVLSESQQAVYEHLLARMESPHPGAALLHGVTGSGKTAVYLRLIRTALDRGRTALLLVPEIALTPQLIALLMSHFGQEVAVLHSALRVTERYDEWKRIRQGKARVVVGTRSAVFAPLEHLGVLIVDEEQEHTYKSENAPRYHAREVALCRGSRAGALVVLGSATPSLETMYLAQSGVYGYEALPGRYNGQTLPQVEIVDMKQELRQGNGTGLSAPLQAAISENLAAGRQSILFLNRRGASRCLICVDCGTAPTCPNCSVSLTYHAANRRLMCHYCGHSQPVPDRCPQCGGHLKPVGTGTQRVEQALLRLYPGTPILRMDADTVAAAGSHEALLDRFQKERIPILVGTQMVAKGLNFENVTLVGVVDADMSLYVDSYRAAETTFSMLTQVVGRSGRGVYPGRAIIQTMTPEHSVIRLAAAQDYGGFYRQELQLRQLHGCPPFGDLLLLTVTGRDEGVTCAAAIALRAVVAEALAQEQVQLLGPVPAVIAKINNVYRYRLTIRCQNRRPLRQRLSFCLREFAKNRKYKGVTAYLDVNSYE